MSEFAVTITEKGGKPKKQAFTQGEVTIGRVAGNDIVLAKGNISKRHSRIVLRDSKFIIVDLKSTNGTYVNGKRIASPQVLRRVDKVYIGDFTIQVESHDQPAAGDEPVSADEPIIEESSEDLFGGNPISDAEDLLKDDSDMLDLGLDEPSSEEVLEQRDAAPEAPATPAKQQRTPTPAPAPRKPKRKANGSAAPSVQFPAAVLDARKRAFDAVRNAIGDRRGAEAVRAAETAAQKALDTLKQKNPPAGANLDAWKQEIVDEVTGTGALGHLLEEDGVREIFVNGPHQIYVSRDGDERQLEPTMFSSGEALSMAVTRLLRGTGLPFNEAHPMADARLVDGTHLIAVHSARASAGPMVTLTRAAAHATSLKQLVSDGVLSKGMAEFLKTCVEMRRNVLLVGTPGADLAGLVSAVVGEVADDERIVAVAQVSGLELNKPHVVTLEARSPARMREALAMGIKMRPDRLVVHEMGGGEALDTLIAMRGPQEGAIATCYAASASEAMSRLSSMVTLGDDLAERIARQQIADALDVVVCLTRFSDASERISEIVEVTGAEVDLVTTQNIFGYKRDSDRFIPRGEPRFYEQLKRRGESLNMAIFSE